MYKNRNRAGFTLVELLVVVAIIGILMALLLPALNKGLRAGRKTVCISNLKQLHTAAMNYANENNGYLPYATSMLSETVTEEEGVSITSNGVQTGWVAWYDMDSDPRTYWWDNQRNAPNPDDRKGTECIRGGTLFEYLGKKGDESVYVCPEHARMVAKDKPKDCSGGSLGASGSSFTAVAVRSYGMNAQVSHANLLTLRGGSRTMLFSEQGYESQSGFISGYALRYVSKTADASDEWNDPELDQQSGNTKYRRLYRSWDAAIDATKNGAICEAIGEMHSRNKNRPEGVAIFVDGHVETVFIENTKKICTGDWGD